MGLGKSLLRVLEQVPDPRSRHGRRHALSAILALSDAQWQVAPVVYTLAQWGRMQDPATLRELGFTRERTPAVSTFHKVFTGMDVEAFEGALGEWIETQMGREEEAIAIDGKALRGIHGDELPGVRLVAQPSQGVGVGTKRGVKAEKGRSDRWQARCWSQ